MKFIKWLFKYQIIEIILFIMAILGFILGIKDPGNSLTIGMSLFFCGYLVRSVTAKYELIKKIKDGEFK